MRKKESPRQKEVQGKGLGRKITVNLSSITLDLPGAPPSGAIDWLVFEKKKSFDWLDTKGSGISDANESKTFFRAGFKGLKDAGDHEEEEYKGLETNPVQEKLDYCQSSNADEGCVEDSQKSRVEVV